MVGHSLGGALARYVHTVNLEKVVKGFKMPTVILCGERDYIMPLWKGQRLNQLIAKSKLVVFENKGHDWILDFPELFWRNF